MKQLITYSGSLMTSTAGFSSEMKAARGQWDDVFTFKELKEKQVYIQQTYL